MNHHLEVYQTYLLLTVVFMFNQGLFDEKETLSCPFPSHHLFLLSSKCHFALLPERDTSTLLWGIFSPRTPENPFPMRFLPMPVACMRFQFGVQEWTGSIRKRVLPAHPPPTPHTHWTEEWERKKMDERNFETKMIWLFFRVTILSINKM